MSNCSRPNRHWNNTVKIMAKYSVPNIKIIAKCSVLNKRWNDTLQIMTKCSRPNRHGNNALNLKIMTKCSIPNKRWKDTLQIMTKRRRPNRHRNNTLKIMTKCSVPNRSWNNTKVYDVAQYSKQALKQKLLEVMKNPGHCAFQRFLVANYLTGEQAPALLLSKPASLQRQLGIKV